MVEMIICERCGKEVPRTGRRQKFCLDCSYQMIIERQNARRHQHTKGMKGTKEITCAMCGKKVTVSIRAGRAKYCSHCAAIAYGEAKKRQVKPRVKAHGVCTVCGREFDYISIGGYERRCCNDCRTRSNVKNRGIINRPPKAKEPEHRASTLAEKLKEAKRLNMSYGKYKTWLAAQKKP